MLLTDWLKIGVAGPTIDGRDIDPEWLHSMARNYDPGTYIASVNEDHFFPGGLGTIHELKTGTDERGRLALFARLNPKAGLLSRVQNGFNVFFSMEVRHNFPEEGQHYLTGLAATDEPASLGLEPTKFAANGAELCKQAIPGRLEKEDICDTDQEDVGDKEKLTAQPEQTPEAEHLEALPGLFQSLLEQIKSLLKGGAGAEPSTETEPMTPEELKRFEALEAQVGEIKELLTAKPADQDVETTDAQDSGEAGGDRGGTAELSADLKTTLEEIKAGQEAINTRLDAHDEFMGETRETEALDVTTGEDGQAAEIW